MRSTARRCFEAVALAAAFTLLAIGGDAAVAQDKAAGAKKAITLRFSWKMKGEYGPLYVALDRGYFAAEGLDVSLKEGAGPSAAFASLMKGEDDISWMPGIYAMQATSKGMPIKIVALYNLAAPIVMVSWPENPIRTPKDMEGKKIATAAGDTGAHFMPVLCRKNGVDCDKIQMVNVALGTQVQAFIGHLVDGVALYKTNDLPILKAKNGATFVEMDETKFGLVLPGGALVTTAAYLNKDPETLKKFVRAANKGMEFARHDPMAAAKIMAKYWNSSLSDEIIAEQIRAVTDATPVIPGKPAGAVDEQAMKDALEGLKEATLVDEVKPVGEYYTNDIVLGTGPAKTN
jgi:NitT/TauT family transport system substrate-binding protein